MEWGWVKWSVSRWATITLKLGGMIGWGEMGVRWIGVKHSDMQEMMDD